METKQEIIDKINAVVVEQFDIEKEDLDLDTSFVKNLNADSLDLVELVMEVEDRCNITILDEEAEKIMTIGDLATFIYKKQSRE